MMFYSVIVVRRKIPALKSLNLELNPGKQQRYREREGRDNREECTCPWTVFSFLEHMKKEATLEFFLG